MKRFFSREPRSSGCIPMPANNQSFLFCFFLKRSVMKYSSEGDEDMIYTGFKYMEVERYDWAKSCCQLLLLWISTFWSRKRNTVLNRCLYSYFLYVFFFWKTFLYVRVRWLTVYVFYWEVEKSFIWQCGKWKINGMGGTKPCSVCLAVSLENQKNKQCGDEQSVTWLLYN